VPLMHRIEHRIYSIRGHKVMLDRELADLYGVKTIALRQQVKRNKARFPRDFLFQLSKKEAEALVSQNVIPSRRSLGGSLPYAFTEQGVAMLSSVLTSRRAVQVNIAIMRAFVKLREILSSHKKLGSKLQALEKKYDHQFKAVFDTIYELMQAPANPRQRRIGFITDQKS
jgi:ORF6N domain